ncbi:ferritin family protein [Azospirillum doebereinerae]|uniref:ferritin-like domain-containing protein n=1 Tax=Azospirillum doebereinerae TaxID=92933 RepID=UPI001EE52AB2|nr:ferritin family protein [Azospirillum doebereinerae]MCG5241642.1 ferritin family protein [Azospirillum doebereinerae]
MPLLHHEPPARIDDLDSLLGIAMAMEAEAVRRYGQLAALMERRGEAATAATFHGLRAEEEKHTDAVDRWATALGRAAPDDVSFLWVLPPDIALSWDDLLDRTRLTPYQALSLAVVNEQRAFAFYSHIAAGTGNDTVRGHAETLAREELQHAALLRRERRKAFHRDHGGAETPVRVDSSAALDRIAQTLLSAAATEHAALSRQLAASGNAAGSALLGQIALEEESLANSGQPTIPATTPPAAAGAMEPWPAAIAIAERLAERFADIAATATDEAVLGRALSLQETAILHLTRLTAHQA